MIPQKGQHVRCVLSNNLIIEGIVDSWEDEKSVLKSLDGESVSIIQNTSRDVVLVKIILKEYKKPAERIVIKNELEKKFDEEKKKPIQDDLRLKNLAELKVLMIEQEKKIISEKLKDHHISDIKKASYGQPKFFKKQRS